MNNNNNSRPEDLLLLPSELMVLMLENKLNAKELCEVAALATHQAMRGFLIRYPWKYQLTKPTNACKPVTFVVANSPLRGPLPVSWNDERFFLEVNLNNTSTPPCLSVQNRITKTLLYSTKQVIMCKFLIQILSLAKGYSGVFSIDPTIVVCAMINKEVKAVEVSFQLYVKRPGSLM